MASPSSVLTQGLGAWGSPSLLITLGFGAGAAVSGTQAGTQEGFRPRVRYNDDEEILEMMAMVMPLIGSGKLGKGARNGSDR